MSEVWWGRECYPGNKASLGSAGELGVKQPELVTAKAASVTSALRARIPSYTPQWTNLRNSDAGIALVRLFGEQVEPVLTRLNRLPERALIGFLATAGVEPLPATPAAVNLQFQLTDDAPESVFIPEGFQVGAKPAGGSGDLVTFETQRGFSAVPARIAELHVQLGTLFHQVDLQDGTAATPFLVFGPKPAPGRALFIGLSGKASPGDTLSLGVKVALPPGAPLPVPSGGIVPQPVLAPPLLRWEVLDGGGYQPAELITDQTGGLQRSGIVTLRLPGSWRVGGRPAGLAGDQPLRWLRLRLLHGSYQHPPQLSALQLNVVEALALKTIFNEVLQPVVADSKGTQMELSQTPVFPGSLVLEVDDGSPEFQAVTLTADGDPVQPPEQVWQEVADLALYGSRDQVYLLDPSSGVVTFGDGVHGALLPKGFRNVRAVRYRVGGGAAGAVDAGAVSTMLSSVPFVKGVSNSDPSTGGTDAESQQHAVRRGPQEIRTGGRSVAPADYALLALRAPGALVKRAYASPARHPSFPGTPIPGVVGVYLVPPDIGAGAPIPDQGTLREVSRYLSGQVAPAGVEVVTAAPRYRRIRAEAAVVTRAGADAGETVVAVAAAIDSYLHPLTGGDDGEGWPFGGTLRYATVLLRLLGLAGVSAISHLNFVVDGLRIAGCTDVPIGEDELFWPEGHQVVVLETREER
jgi:predicted phage baseplate assembly protein